MPTAIASDSARQRWTRERLSGPEIQGESPGAVEVRPSRDIASFRVTNGRPVRACLRKGWLRRRAAVASSPAAKATSTPPSRRIPGPRPAAFSEGSSEAITTRAIPASRIASTQGGWRPWWAQGSSVTYIVAPAGIVAPLGAVGECGALRVQPAELGMETLAENLAVADDDGADQRIRG